MARSKYRFPDRASAEKAVATAEESLLVLGWIVTGKCVPTWHSLDAAQSLAYLVSPRKTNDYLLERTHSGVSVRPFDEAFAGWRRSLVHMAGSKDAFIVAEALDKIAQERQAAYSGIAA